MNRQKSLGRAETFEKYRKPIRREIFLDKAVSSGRILIPKGCMLD